MAFDLVNIPLKPTTAIYKQNDRYCFRLSQEIDSKLMTSDYKEYQKTFVMITIKNEYKNENVNGNTNYKIDVVDSTMCIYNFNQFVDFFIPCDASHYCNLYEKLLCTDIEKFDCTQNSADSITNFTAEPLPFYCVPNLSLVKPYKTLPVDIIHCDVKPQANAIIFDWSSKSVPTKPDDKYANEMQQKEEYSFVINFLEKAFNEQKICDKTHSKISYKNFCEYYKKYYKKFMKEGIIVMKENEDKVTNMQQEYKSEDNGEDYTNNVYNTQQDNKTNISAIKKIISKSAYFSYLPLVSYHTLKGPWSRCWIKFGYDPRQDYKNYVYQRLTKYKFTGLVNFLFEDSTIYNILKQNESKYVTKKYTKENGFFKKDFINFLAKYCKKKNIEKITHKQESENSCFDIL
ncbi:General transcription factor 3C polypeptide 5 [Binucleata daphniae]